MNQVKYENFIREVIYEKASDFAGENGFAYFNSISIDNEISKFYLLVKIKICYGDNDYYLTYSDGGLLRVIDVEGNEIYGASAYSTEPKAIEEIL